MSKKIVPTKTSYVLFTPRGAVSVRNEEEAEKFIHRFSEIDKNLDIASCKFYRVEYYELNKTF